MQDGEVNIGYIIQLTDIDPCTKCKKRDGYIWHWGNISNSKGYAECKACGAKF